MSWKYPTLWKYTAREVQRRPGRTVLTLLGIIIGVAGVVATGVMLQAMRHAYRDLFETATGRASLEVVAEGYAGFDPGIIAILENVPGVRAALPIIQSPAVLTSAAGTHPVLVLGVDPNRDELARDYVFRAGRSLGQEDGLLLEAGFAESRQFSLGMRVRLWTPSGLCELPIVGLLEPQSAATFNGGAVVFMPLTTAQRLFALHNRINAVHLVLNDGIDPGRLTAELRDLLPAGLTVQSPSNRGALGQEVLLMTQQGLGCLSVVSLVAGAFVIVNAFLMNLGERRRQLAILRALGATRSQITRLLLREAVGLGLAGTVLGIGVGSLLAAVALRVAAGTMGLSARDVGWSIEPFLVALLMGPGMCLAATFVPARRAGHTAPLAALMPRWHGREPGLSRGLGYLGLLLSASPLGLEIASYLRWVSPPATPFFLGLATLLALAGSGLLIPLLLPPLLRFVGQIFRPLFGTIGRLAVRQLARHQPRTALTVGVLTIAVVFVLFFGTTLLNRLGDIRRWYERFAYGDFYIRSAFPDLTTLVTGASLPEEVGAELEILDGVARLDRIDGILTHVGGQPVLVLAMTLSQDRQLPFELVTDQQQLVGPRLAQGEVILGTGLARQLRLGVGDEIEFATPRGPQSRRIAALTQDYGAGGMVLIMENGDARRLFHLKGVLCYVVTAQPGAEPELAERLRTFCHERGLILDSKQGTRAWFASKIEGMVALCWCLLALVFVVASLGITNNLTMNLLEQSREIAVLRAIGMRRGQVRSLLLCQALAIGLVSLVPGLFLGIAWSYLMHRPRNPTLGPMTHFQFNAWFLVGCGIAAVIVPLGAALYPAQRAARLHVIQTLHYE